MTFSYDRDVLNDPTDERFPLSWVRILIGDTDLEDTDNQLLSDEELLSIIGDVIDKDQLYEPAADAADLIATKFRKYPVTRIGGLANIDARHVVEQYEALAESLRAHLQGTPMIAVPSLETKRKAFHTDRWDDMYF